MPNSENIEALLREVLSVNQQQNKTLEYQNRTLDKLDLTVNGDGNGRRGLVRKLDGLMKDAAYAKWLFGAIFVALIGAWANQHFSDPPKAAASTSQVRHIETAQR